MGRMKELFMQEREKQAIHLSSDEDYQYEMYRLQREMEEKLEKERLNNQSDTNANTNRNSGTIS